MMIHWIKAVVSELFAIALFLSLYPFKLEKKNPKLEELTQKKPLVLAAHGYMLNSSCWRFTKKYFETRGHPFLTVTKKKMGGSIDCYGDQIIELLEQYLPYIEKNGVRLLGHSMGGLAAASSAIKFLKRHPMLDGKIEVVTIASPLEGTYLASIGIGTCARQMEYRSPYTLALNETIEKHKDKILFRHIATKNDFIVVPYSSSIRSKQQTSPHITVTQGIGHAALLLHSKLIYS